ncbi:MAG: DUF5662 family protein [Coriobacteriia bacterium]|nr:DUF5662 family protein [Coriobacteriia bacterium]
MPSSTYDRPAPSLRNAAGHFCTITQHKLLVMRLCWKVGLYKQALLHDLSKYAPAEFMTGARYWQGDRSPNAVEREREGVSGAWLHHKGRNKHHYEYWIDIVGKGNHAMEGKPMPVRYVVEMFCDRVAACKVYLGENYTCRSALEYYQRENSDVPILLHPEARALLEGMLDMLAEAGEERTFAAIKHLLVQQR